MRTLRRLTPPALALTFAVLLAVTPFAQPRPGSFTTVTTTDTSANSLLVGCAVGSTTCTGGIKAGPFVGTTVTGTTVTGTALVGGTVAGTTGAFSGTITASGAAPQISLTNGTSNWIDWAAVGTAAPTFTTRSVGTKLVLFPNVGASAADFGLGVESGAAWFSVPTTTNTIYLYGGTTRLFAATGASISTLTPRNILNGTLEAPSAQALTTAAGTNNDVAVTAGVSTVNVTSTAGSTNNVTGFTGGVDGRILWVCYVGGGAVNVGFLPEDLGSTAANRFAGVLTLASGVRACSQIRYNGAAQRWYPLQ